MKKMAQKNSSHKVISAVLLSGAVTAFIIAFSLLTAIDKSHDLVSVEPLFEVKDNTPSFSIKDLEAQKPTPIVSITDLLKAQVVTAPPVSAELPVPSSESFFAEPPISNYLFTAETALEITAEAPFIAPSKAPQIADSGSQPGSQPGSQQNGQPDSQSIVQLVQPTTNGAASTNTGINAESSTADPITDLSTDPAINAATDSVTEAGQQADSAVNNPGSDSAVANIIPPAELVAAQLADAQPREVVQQSAKQGQQDAQEQGQVEKKPQLASTGVQTSVLLVLILMVTFAASLIKTRYQK